MIYFYIIIFKKNTTKIYFCYPTKLYLIIFYLGKMYYNPAFLNIQVNVIEIENCMNYF